jgi:HEAT repeat protein/cyclophilin family peptidyl-prolyl cis-trans isomerase
VSIRLDITGYDAYNMSDGRRRRSVKASFDFMSGGGSARRPGAPIAPPAGSALPRHEVISMKKLIALAAIAILLPFASAPHAQSIYERLLSRKSASDTLLTLAAWEDGRVTGDGSLFRFLRADEPLVRLRAVEVIGRIQDRADASQLVPMLADRDARVVAEAAFALGQMGDSTYAAPLAQLVRTASPELAGTIAEALGKIGGVRSTGVLTDMLRNPEDRIRQSAALALARSADSSAAPALLVAVHDPDPGVVWRAIYALEKTRSKRIVNAVIPFLDHQDPAVRAFAARCLGKQQDPDAGPMLIAVLGDPEVPVVVNAARALGELKYERGVHPLGELLRNHSSHHVRREAARSLGIIGSISGKDYLIEACFDRSAGVRTEVVRSIALVLRRESGMFLTMMLDDSDTAVRASAIEGFGIAEIGTKIDFLIEKARQSDDLLAEQAAVRALGHFHEVRIRDVLKELVLHGDWVAATEAVAAIGARRDVGAVALLLRAYDERSGREEGNIRLAILDVLTDFKAAESSRLAFTALEDADKRIRLKAIALLRALGVEPPELKPDRYFYEKNFDPSRKKKLSLPLGTKHATLRHPHGTVELELFGDDAIQTVAMFLKLARSGSYNGRTFHRVVPNFVAQGGCPRGDGWGDEGYYIREEYNRHQYERGYIGIATDGKDTGGSQFFITLSPQHHLDGRYTIFGRVVKGMETIDLIDQGDTFEISAPAPE